MVSFVQQGIATFFLYGIFGLSSLATWLLVRSTFQGTSATSVGLTGSVIAGPILIGALLWLLMWVAPGQSISLYVAACTLVPGLVTVLHARALFADAGALSERIGGHGWLRTSLIFAVAGLSVPVLLFPQLLLLPLGGNDPLEYMQLGRAFFDARDASAYPYLTSAETGGFISPWTHPPTYGVLVALAYMLQGSAEVAGAAKLIGLWFATGTAMFCGALIYTTDRRFSLRVMAAPLLVMTIPLYFSLVQSAHIDAMRIATFTLAAGMATFVVSQGTIGAAVVAGVAVSVALLSHSIGILAPLILLPFLIVTWQRGVLNLFRVLIVIGLVVTVLGLPHYIRNIWIFGNPIQDSVPIWELQSMGFADFLRTSRGLETFMDRIYHGALLPFTRVSEFGWLSSCLLLVGSILLLQRTRRGVASFVAEVVRTRQSSMLTQLALFVAGFFAFILLTVLAGSELAVKNSRYLLTILPLAVTLLLLLAGRLLPDEPAALDFLEQVAWTPLRWFRRLFSKATEARTAGFASRPSNRALLLLLLLGSAFLHQVYHVLRVSYSNTAVYLGVDGISWSRIGESEWMKRDGSALPDAVLERETRSLVQAGESVLVFRQASFGFFKVAPFRFYIERTLEPLFLETDPHSLRQKLHDEGLSWLYIPNYPMAEIQNSAFARLLIDPTLVRPERKVGNWMLYKVLPDHPNVEMSALDSAVPYAANGRGATATTEVGGGQVDGENAFVRLDPISGSAELVRRRGMIKKLDRWDALMRRPMKTGLDPEAINAVDFRFGNEGLVLVTATLAGKGLAEIAVEYARWDPREDRAFFPATGDSKLFPTEGDESGEYASAVQRELIWTGTLTGEKRVVGGWLMPTPTMSDADNKRGGRLIFRLRDGDFMQVHDWQAVAVRYEGAKTRSDVFRDAVRKGWIFRGESRPVEYGLQVFHSSGPEKESTLDYVLERPTTAPVLVSPPVHRLDGKINASRFLHLLSNDDLALHVKAKVFGSGQVVPELAYVCRRNVNAADNAYQLSLEAMNMISAPGMRQVQRAPLKPMYLLPGVVEEAAWSVRVPCIPGAVRLLLNSEFSRFVTPERISEDPDLSKRGSIGVKDVRMELGSLRSVSEVVPISLGDE